VKSNDYLQGRVLPSIDGLGMNVGFGLIEGCQMGEGLQRELRKGICLEHPFWHTALSHSLRDRSHDGKHFQKNAGKLCYEVDISNEVPILLM
jgi:hypothetical protein